MDQAATPNHILTIEEVAETLRCSKAHVSKALSGKIPGVPRLTHLQWEGASLFDVNGLMNGWKPTKSDDTIRTRTGFTAKDAERNFHASQAVSAG
jgi:hypothetical protein